MSFTFQESAYITEVHHVNGEGEDAGVVYCEMQGRENMERSLTFLNFTREMYPGHCGYKVQFKIKLRLKLFNLQSWAKLLIKLQTWRAFF